MDDDDDINGIVIDSGSGTCKAGFACDDAPRSVFSSVVGTPRFQQEDYFFDQVVGDEAQTAREFVSMNYPIERGIVTNWDDAEKLWECCFKDLKVDPKEHPVFMSEPVLNPSGNKEKMVEHMFETFQVPGYFSSCSAILSLLASGRGVGLMLDIGEGVTHIVPIHLTIPSPLAVCRQEFAGRDVTLYLQDLLHQRGYSFTTTAELEYVREIKERLCYTSLDYNDELSKYTPDSEFILPDGNKVTISEEKFQCAECLFQPSLAGFDSLKGLHEMLQDSIQNCDIDIRKDFYCNVILSGGTSLMPNLTDRLGKLWQQSVPATQVSKLVCAPERKYNVWIGGSILASLSTFQKYWIKKEEYEEVGPNVVYRSQTVY